MKKKPLTITEFWEHKHAIDDEVTRLGWSKQECIDFIKQRYGCRSRLAMHDMQLRECLEYLRGLLSEQTTTQKLSTRKGRRRRKRK